MVSARPVDSPSANSASYLPPHDGVDCIIKITGPGVTAGIGETGEEWSRNTSIGRDGAILFFLEQIEWLSINGSSLTLVGVWQTTSHNHVTGPHSSEAHYRLPLDENQAPASHHVASVAAKSFSRPHGNGREGEGEGPPPLQKEKAPRPKPNTIWQPGHAHCPPHPQSSTASKVLTFIGARSPNPTRISASASALPLPAI